MYDSMVNLAIRIIVNCIVFSYFVFIPFKNRFKYSYFKTASLALLLTVITLAIYIFFFTPGLFLAVYSKLGVLLWIVSAILIFRIAIKGSFFEILFIVLVVLNLYVNIVTIAEVIMNKMDLHMEAARTFLELGILAAYIPVLWILMDHLYKQVIEFNVKLSFWKYIWVIPTLTYMIFWVKVVNDYYRNQVRVGVWDIIFVVLWSFSTYAFFCVTLLMLIQTYKGMTAGEQAHVIAAQLKIQEGQYEKLLDNIEQTARLRHDWRHHLLSINGYVENGNKADLQKYLMELSPKYFTEKEASLCENHVVDVILQHNAAIAKKQGVVMNIAANIDKVLSIPNTDLCIIFGNLIENAVEACTRRDEDKEIVIKAVMKGKQLILLVKNTYQEKVAFKEDIYYSTKHEGVGIGLSTVQNIVGKHKGVMKIEFDENYFKVYVLINVN